jgi:hypothetical protein
MIKKRIFAKKLFKYFKTLTTKKYIKFSVFFTVYRMRHAIVGGNFTPIGKYSIMVKHRHK